MAVYKEEKTNTWRVIYRYTDWTGEKKQTQKRGFKTKREAQAWEREQLHKVSADLDMTFTSFFEQYTADMQTRIKENTWATKEHIIRTKLIPYFGKLKMSNITAQQIITWQNELMNYKDENGKPLSPVYLKTINNQLSAIFNHAVKYYNLRENPCKKAGSMGKKKNREMLFWTKEEYLKFAEVMMDIIPSSRCLCAGGRERNSLDETMQRPRFGRYGQGENHASQHEQEMGLQACYRRGRKTSENENRKSRSQTILLGTAG